MKRLSQVLLVALSVISQESAAQTLLREIGGTGTAPGQFVEINGIAIDEDGRLFVLDAGNGRVQVLDSDGTFLRSFATPGEGPGELGFACGIALNPRLGRVYVSEGIPLFVNRVQAFDIDGTFLFSFGSEGSGDGEFDTPCQIAIGPENRVFVTDAGNSRVQVFDADGRFLSTIGTPGTGDGELNRPMGVTIANANRLYVSDSFSPRVQAFTLDGTFLFSFGMGGTGEGQFQRPCHLAALGHELGFVYVADAQNQRVQVLDVDGIYHEQVSGLSLTLGSLNCGLTPFTMAVDAEGLLYIEDLNSIKVFTIDRDGDGLLDIWETAGVDVDNDGIVDLDLPNIAGLGVGADPDHKDIFLELDWEVGSEPNQAAIQSMKTAFAFAPVDAGGIANPDGLPGINLWVDTGGLTVLQGSEDGAGPGTCFDGIDNGGEGFTDLSDSQCGGSEDGFGLGSCVDGIDNGGDGSTDTADSDCFMGDDLRRESGGAAGSCRDGVDNDMDGLTDVADVDCFVGGNPVFNPAGNESGGAPDMSCSDGADNDGDGLTDGLDPGCAYTGSAYGVNGTFYLLKSGGENLRVEDGAGPGSCFDGVDNGAMDGDIDGKDIDCRPQCFDGRDNDMDGLADGDDPNCAVGGNFDRKTRKLVFHYAISAPAGGGQGERGGNDFVTRNGGDGGTMMHELGHNLNLEHGGGDSVNRKPNYISVMDYDEQFCIFPRGASATLRCTASLRRLLDFSPARYQTTENSTSLTSCYDGRDNDGDNLIDADDPDCFVDLQRGAAPLSPMNETALDESDVFDTGDTGHSVVYHDATGAFRLWNADGDIDGDGTAEGVDWLGDGLPYSASALTIDANRDSICVCSDSDGTLETMMPGGDDVMFPAGLPGCAGPTIRNGMNLICETTAAATDQQVRQERDGGRGSCTDGVDNDSDGDIDDADTDCFETPILRGHDDWSVIVMDFRRFTDPPEFGLEEVVVDDPITVEDFEQQLELLNNADLAVSVGTDPDPVEVGSDLVYTIDITNQGPNPAASVLARQFLDPSTTLVSHASACSETSAGELECAIGALRLNGSTALDVTVATGTCVADVPAVLTYRSVVENLAGPDPDMSNNSVEVTVTPVDTTAPTIESIDADRLVLWPPNHEMLPVSLDVVAVDSCTTAPTCRITSVTSNEPVSDRGSGNTTPDWVVTGDLTVDLRAERAGRGSGRIYTVTVECSDASSNHSSASITIAVPHD